MDIFKFFDENIFNNDFDNNLYKKKNDNKIESIESVGFDISKYSDTKLKVTQTKTKFQLRDDKNNILYSDDLPYDCKINKIIKKDNFLFILFD